MYYFMKFAPSDKLQYSTLLQNKDFLKTVYCKILKVPKVILWSCCKTLVTFV